MAPEKYETNGLNIILDFEDKEENGTLSPVDESQGPSTSREGRAYLGGASKDIGTQFNPLSNHAMEEHSAGEEFEETSLLEPEGGFLKPYSSYLQCIMEYVRDR